MTVEKSLILHLSDDRFALEVEQLTNTLVLVDFWAPWCGPCHIMTPILEDLAQYYKDNTKVKLCKLNVDENSQTAEKYLIRSIPTIKFFLDGKIIDETIGTLSQEALARKIEEGMRKIK